MSDQASRTKGRLTISKFIELRYAEYQLPQNKRFCTNSISNQRSKYEVEEPGQILGDRHVNFQSSVSRVFSLLVKKEAISDSVFTVTSVRIITMFTTATVNEHRWYYHSDFYRGVVGFWKISLYWFLWERKDCIFLFLGWNVIFSFLFIFRNINLMLLQIIILFKKLLSCLRNDNFWAQNLFFHVFIYFQYLTIFNLFSWRNRSCS